MLCSDVQNECSQCQANQNVLNHDILLVSEQLWEGLRVMLSQCIKDYHLTFSANTSHIRTKKQMRPQAGAFSISETHTIFCESLDDELQVFLVPVEHLENLCLRCFAKCTDKSIRLPKFVADTVIKCELEHILFVHLWLLRYFRVSDYDGYGVCFPFPLNRLILFLSPLCL